MLRRALYAFSPLFSSRTSTTILRLVASSTLRDPSISPSLWRRQKAPRDCTDCAQNCLGSSEEGRYRIIYLLIASVQIKFVPLCDCRHGDEYAYTYFGVIRSFMLCSARSGMQRSSSSQPFQKGSLPKRQDLFTSKELLLLHISPRWWLIFLVFCCILFLRRLILIMAKLSKYWGQYMC